MGGSVWKEVVSSFDFSRERTGNPFMFGSLEESGPQGLDATSAGTWIGCRGLPAAASGFQLSLAPNMLCRDVHRTRFKISQDF